MEGNGHMDNTGNCFNVEKSQFVTNGNLGELQMSIAFPFRLKIFKVSKRQFGNVLHMTECR